MDEWTKAETGVGAAIAMGSQGENGNCALLVIAANRTAKISAGDGLKNGRLQCAEGMEAAIPTIKAISPTRFVRAVIIPAPRVEGVW